jgi:hypothetical protein
VVAPAQRPPQSGLHRRLNPNSGPGAAYLSGSCTPGTAGRWLQPKNMDTTALLEYRSPATMKCGCNRAIFLAIPSNCNNVTLVKSGCM